MDMAIYPGAMVSKSDEYLIKKAYQGLKKKNLCTKEYEDRLTEDNDSIPLIQS